ncbi:ATP-binding protein [Chloroflexota bacterium]
MFDTLVSFFSVFITDAGNLTYHLVLAFSVAGALYFTMATARRSPAIARRVSLGLGLLLTLRLVLFVASGLAWQELISGQEWLPLLDRGVTLLSLVLIIWLWSFPEHSPGADSGTILLGLLLLTLVILGTVWWSDQDIDQVAVGGFNRSLLDLVSGGVAMALLILGGLLLLALRPESWTFGLGMFVLLLVGHILHLVFPLGNESYPVLVRLFQIAAYPFLLLLPQRMPLPDLGAATAPPGEVELPLESQKSDPYPAVKVLAAVQKTMEETKPQRISQEITAAVAKVLDADISLLVTPPDDNNLLSVLCGFDRSQGRYLTVGPLDGKNMSGLVSKGRTGRTRRLSSSSDTTANRTLARACGLESTGGVLYAPVLNQGGDMIASLILLSPYQTREWSEEDGAFLGILGYHLVQFLQLSEEMETISLELEHERQVARNTQDQAQRALDQSQKLRDQIAVKNDDLVRERAQLASMASIISAGSVAQEDLERLQAENEELRSAVLQATEQAAEQESATDGEIRLALEEVAFLRNTLYEADKKVFMLKASLSGGAPSNEQLADIVTIAQDLRGPLASIIGYSDYLLSEVIGILGAAQRKYLERIRISSERMNRLVDDLIQTVSIDSGLAQLASEELDLNETIQGVVAQVDEALNEKMIKLEMDLPEGSVVVHADQGALRQVFSQLLQNAGLVTPHGGQINLQTHLEGSEGDQDYVLVQVVDGGGGISAQDLSRVFSPRPLGVPLVGVGLDGDDLPTVKALVEVFGGRIWVDSELGQGSTFSVLLPIVQPNGGAPPLEIGG